MLDNQMLDDIRTYARLQLEIQQGMTRADYVVKVREYAVEKYGGEAQLIAERTARHVWDSKR